MTTWKGKAKYTLEGNLRVLKGKAKIGDIFKNPNSKNDYKRVDARKHGSPWEIIR